MVTGECTGVSYLSVFVSPVLLCVLAYHQGAPPPTHTHTPVPSPTHHHNSPPPRNPSTLTDLCCCVCWRTTRAPTSHMGLGPPAVIFSDGKFGPPASVVSVAQTKKQQYMISCGCLACADQQQQTFEFRFGPDSVLTQTALRPPPPTHTHALGADLCFCGCLHTTRAPIPRHRAWAQEPNATSKAGREAQAQHTMPCRGTCLVGNFFGGGGVGCVERWKGRVTLSASR